MSRCVCSALLSADVRACRAGCSVPFSLFFGTLFLVTLSCYTLEFVREGTADGQKPERYCFDPAVGQCAPASRAPKIVSNVSGSSWPPKQKNAKNRLQLRS